MISKVNSKRAPILRGMVGRKATALPRRARMATRLLWVAIGCVMIAASASRAGQGSGAVFSSRCRVPLHELRLRGGQPPAPFGWEQGEGCDEEDCKELAAEVQSYACPCCATCLCGVDQVHD